MTHSSLTLPESAPTWAGDCISTTIATTPGSRRITQWAASRGPGTPRAGQWILLRCTPVPSKIRYTSINNDMFPPRHQAAGRRRLLQFPAADPLCCIALLLLALATAMPHAQARVERLDILERQDFAAGTSFGSSGAYEKLRGRAWFALDPAAPANAQITDLELAPRDGRGLVTFSTDFLVLRPVDASRGNNTLLYEVNNRGGIGMLETIGWCWLPRSPPITASRSPDVLPTR